MFESATPLRRHPGHLAGASLRSSRFTFLVPAARRGSGRQAMTLVEVMVSFAVLVVVASGILGAIVLAARIQQRSRLRAEAFTVAGFIADQIRGSGANKLALGATGVAGSEIGIQLPPSVMPSYQDNMTKTADPALSSFVLYCPLKITAQGTAYGGKSADIRSGTENYAELWSKVSGSTKVNLLYTDVRTQDLVNLGDWRYQLAKPWAGGRDTSGGLFRTYVVVMVTQNAHTNLNGSVFTDYLIRVDVAFDPAQMPGNQSVTATARTYMTPDVLTKPNVLFVK